MKAHMDRQAFLTVTQARILTVLIATLLLGGGQVSAQHLLGPDSLRSSLEHLAGQSVPNQIVPAAEASRHGLVLSYAMSPQNKVFQYIGRRTNPYDNAMVAIAMTMSGQPQIAERIIDGLIRSAPPPPRVGRDVFLDGDLWFSVNTHNAYPSQDNDGQARIRTGANCWAGYAITYVLQAARAEHPMVLQRKRARRYLAFAERMAKAVMARQINDVHDMRHNLVTGGWGTYKYKGGSGRPVEVFVPGELSWCSTEHNIAAYFFLRELAALTGNDDYRHTAEQIRDALLFYFNEQTGQFARGVGTDGPDHYLALDVASWGSLFLLAIGEEDKARRALEATLRYENESSGVYGYRPAAGTRVYESMAQQLWYFPNEPNRSWDETPLVWSEGSLGVAMACLRLDEVDRGKRILQAMLGPTMNIEGGIRYADRVIEGEFEDSPSSASTAWAVMSLHQLQRAPLADLFLGPDLGEARARLVPRRYYSPR